MNRAMGARLVMLTALLLAIPYIAAAQGADPGWSSTAGERRSW